MRERLKIRTEGRFIAEGVLCGFEVNPLVMLESRIDHSAYLNVCLLE